MIKAPSKFRKHTVRWLLFVLLFAFPKTRRKWTKVLTYASLWRVLKVSYLYHFCSPKKFKYNLAVVACCKDEGMYIQEWVEYYLLQGVDHFYIYNNNGTDNTEEILRPYIDKGIVSWFVWPGKEQQVDIYTDAVRRFKNEARWMAIIDLDEFVVPMKKQTTLAKLLDDYTQYNQLIVPWVSYGSSGHKKITPGLVIERFTKHENRIFSHKAIINPRSCVHAMIHAHIVLGKTVDENKKELVKGLQPTTANIVRINHYVIKSWEEYELKKKRGRADFDVKRTDEFFVQADTNDIEEADLMKEYAEAIHKRIDKK